MRSLPVLAHRVTRSMVFTMAIVLFAVVAGSSCGNSGGPSALDCELDRTGALVLVNLSDSGAARDVYVDGHIVTTVPAGGQAVVDAAAGAVHAVEWVSPLSGTTVD